MRNWISTALALLTATLIAGTAHAGLLDTYLESGVNLLKDDSGELVMRFDEQLQDYVFVDDGQLQVNDILISVFDISWVNDAANVLEPSTEVTGVMIATVAGITDVSPAGPFTTGDLELAAVDPFLTSALLGIPAAAGDVAYFFEDAGNDLNISTDNPLTALASATNGSMILSAALTAPTDYLQGNDVYLDMVAYTPLAGPPGVTPRGGFEGGLSITQWNLSGSLNSGAMCPQGIFGDCHDMVVSGTYLISELNGFDIQNDAQFSFSRTGESTPPDSVPAPAVLGLLGFGLAGLSMARRRRLS